MKLSIGVTLALIAMTLTTCASSAPEPIRPWSIEIVTSGGITGRGIGTYVIDSDGNVMVLTPKRERCDLRATAEEIESIEALLVAAEPSTWYASYVPADRCCDRVEYTLTLKQADRTFETEWIDASLPRPDELLALTDAILGGTESVRTRHECR